MAMCQKTRAAGCARLMNVTTMLRKEESVSGMVQRRLVKLAVKKDAPTKPSREVFVVDMVAGQGQMSLLNFVAQKDAPTFALGTGQRRPNSAAMKDALTMHR